MELQQSTTKINLMRAFAGESQARNRYIFAALQAHKAQLHVVKALFEYTADQELAHAKVFMDHLKDFAGENITIDGAYPVDPTASMIEILRASAHNEQEEHSNVYPEFARIATEEEFPKVAASFTQIATIENIHGSRFLKFADWMEQGKLFKEDQEVEWMCLNCGHIHKGFTAPAKCPVCDHPQGYFVRYEMSPYCILGVK